MPPLPTLNRLSHKVIKTNIQTTKRSMNRSKANSKLEESSRTMKVKFSQPKEKEDKSSRRELSKHAMMTKNSTNLDTERRSTISKDPSAKL